MDTSNPVESVPVPTSKAETALSTGGDLPQQFRQLLRAAVVLAAVVATIQALELWRCWRARPAAQQAAQLRAGLQRIGTVIEDYRQVSAHHPELIAIGRKYGVEPAGAASGVPATDSSTTTNRSAFRP